jgi:hypothetical protein
MYGFTAYSVAANAAPLLLAKVRAAQYIESPAAATQIQVNTMGTALHAASGRIPGICVCTSPISAPSIHEAGG